MDIRKILVPVDFSACSRDALKSGQFLARTLGAARLIVLNVFELPQFMAPDPVFYTGTSGQTMAEIIRGEAEEQARKLVDRVLGSVDVDIRVEAGVPYASIVELAETENVDMIVMGTHGHTGLARVLLGSVAEKVVRHAPCPVLTIRRKNEEK